MGVARRSARAGWRSERRLRSTRATTGCSMRGVCKLDTLLDGPKDGLQSKRR